MAELDERKKLILRAIVEDYIKNAEPVGSRSIAKKTGLNLSAATIRNEMGDLEDIGMLIQPHTSAGRIPSNSGFRFYVDNLMYNYQMTALEIQRLRRALLSRFRELDNIIRSMSSAFSAVTNMPTFAMMPVGKYGRIQTVKLANIDGKSIMVIVSSTSGLIKNKLLRLRNTISDEEVKQLNSVINEHISGIEMNGYVDLDKIIGVKNAVGDNVEILSSILELIHEASSEIDKKQLVVEGASNILRFPEYNDVDKIKNILEFFDDKNVLSEAIDSLDLDNDDGVNIFIGDEIPLPQLKENSLIVSRYRVGEELMGIVGIIGPRRLDYARVVSGIKFFSESLAESLNNSISPRDKNSKGVDDG